MGLLSDDILGLESRADVISLLGDVVAELLGGRLLGVGLHLVGNLVGNRLAA